MAIYDPNSSNSSNSKDVHPGQKLISAVAFDRWHSKTGSQMLEVWFVVLRDDAETGDEGALTRRSFALTDKAIQFWGRYCLALGYTQPHDPEDDDVVDHIIGIGPVIATIKGREWNGETKYEPDQFRSFRGEPDPSWDELIEQGRERYARIQVAREAKRNGGGGGGGGFGGGGQRSSGAPRVSRHGFGGSGGQGGDNSDIPF